MGIRIGINGFGRIGRNFYRAAYADKDLEIAAVNDLGSIQTMAHLLANDSVLGKPDFSVAAEEGAINIDGSSVPVFAEKDPASLPWSDLGINVVIESTGFFTSKEKAALHLEAGAGYVVISAPGKDVDATFVVGVNDDAFDPEQHKVVSNASCTTNCFVPMVKVLDDAFGVEQGFMTTIHSYTGDQMLVDGPHSDLRRARAAAINIVPTSTGAARATGLVLQSLDGKLDGKALRVPIPVGSLTDFTALLSKPAGIQEINDAFSDAASTGPLAKVLEYRDAPIVSQDIVGASASCIFDPQLTMADKNLAKVFGWYDNEWGYSNRLVDLVKTIASAAAF